MLTRVFSDAHLITNPTIKSGIKTDIPLNKLCIILSILSANFSDISLSKNKAVPIPANIPPNNANSFFIMQGNSNEK